VRLEAAGGFDQPSLFHKAAQVLLVNPDAGQRLDHALELSRVKAPEQLEDTGRYFSLPRRRLSAVASIRRWSKAIDWP